MLVEVSLLVVNSGVVLNLVMLVSIGIFIVVVNFLYMVSLVMVFGKIMLVLVLI